MGVARRRSGWRIACLLATAAFLAIAIGSGCRRSSPDPSLLLITVDTLRADRMSLLGNPRKTSPNIDSWAAGGVVFEHAYAPRGQTWPSLTSLLTGKYPVTHGVRTNGDQLRAEQQTLAERLQAEGFVTGAFLSNMGQAPNRGFEEKQYSLSPARPQFERDREVVQWTISFLRRHRGERFFAWVHLVAPHEPYLPPAPYDEWKGDYSGSYTGRSEQLDQVALDPSIPFDQRDKAAILALYDGEVRSTDAQIGLLLEALSALGLDDNTLVILTADHGEELFDHNRYAFHSASIYDGVVRVPLVFKLSGRIAGGRRIGAVVELIDILPTVLDLLSLPLPPDVQGESLLPILEGTRTERLERAAFFEWSPPRSRRPYGPADRVFAMREGKWKLVSNARGLRPWDPPYVRIPGAGFPLARTELYDLEADPGETRNLAATEPEVVSRMSSKLESWLADSMARQGGSDTPSEETLRQLRQLGYVDGP